MASHSNENQTDAKYTDIEVIEQPELSSTESRFKLAHIVINSIRSHWEENGKFKLIITALGIFLSYIIVGILQEKIMRGCYSDKNGICNRFTFAITLVGVQFIFSFTFIKVLDIIKPEERDSTNFIYYVLAAAANSMAMVSSNMALKWVTYPMQVIFKSAKPISVMISGLFICKRYTAQRYIFVLIIVAGVVVFKFFESNEGKSEPTKVDKIKENEDKTDKNNYQMYGTALLILSLTMDGILGAIQDKIRAVYAPTPRQFMIGMSAYGAVILIIAIIITGEIKEVLAFASHHPEVLWHIGTFAVAGVVGQLFIFTMIASFGSLACSVTTTWLGAALVFTGLFADAFFGKKHSSKPNQTDLQSENVENAERLILENPNQNPTLIKSNSTQQSSQAMV